LSAGSRNDLLAKLSATDISVPLVTEQIRTKDHREAVHGPSFERIYVCSGDLLLRLSPSQVTATPIHNVWRDF
jgi:hypothetical protein